MFVVLCRPAGAINKATSELKLNLSELAREYTNDALETLVEAMKSVQQRVVTISGEQLAQLMLENGVGVRLESSYQIFKVDEDFFGD